MDIVSLYYEERGSGTPVVLLHGFPPGPYHLESGGALLEIHARLILPDLRGHGKSPLGQVNSIREMAEDVAVLLDMLDISRAILVGHSMGGYVALAFCPGASHRLAGLGLVASQAESDTRKNNGRYNTAADVRSTVCREIGRGHVAKIIRPTRVGGNNSTDHPAGKSRRGGFRPDSNGRAPGCNRLAG